MADALDELISSMPASSGGDALDAILASAPAAKVPGMEQLGGTPPPPATFKPTITTGAMGSSQATVGRAPTTYKYYRNEPSGRSSGSNDGAKWVDTETGAPVRQPGAAPQIQAEEPAAPPKPVTVFERKPGTQTYVGPGGKTVDTSKLAPTEEGVGDAARELRDLILGPAYGAKLKSDSGIESIVNGLLRATAGLNTPESVATWAVGAGIASKLPELVNSVRFRSAVAQYPTLSKGIDIASRTAVPTAFGAQAVATSVPPIAHGIQTGNPEEIAQGGAGLLMGGVALGHAGITGAETASTFPPEASPEAQTRAAEVGGIARPPVTPEQAQAMAAALESQGRGLAAEAWKNLDPNRPAKININGRDAFVSRATKPKGSKFAYQTVTDTNGKILTAGTPDAVRAWLQVNQATRPEFAGEVPLTEESRYPTTTSLRQPVPIAAAAPPDALDALIAQAPDMKPEPPRPAEAVTSEPPAVRPVIPAEPATVSPAPAAAPVLPRPEVAVPAVSPAAPTAAPAPPAPPRQEVIQPAAPAVPEGKAEAGLAAGAAGPQTEDIITGTVDKPLTEEGKQDAKELGQETAGATSVNTSPMDRAEETGAEVAKANDVKSHDDKSLGPWNLGELQGQRQSDAKEQIDHYIQNPDEVVPGGESFNTYRGRLIGGVQQQIADWRPGTKPVNVTHSIGIHTIQAWLANGAPEDGSIDVQAMLNRQHMGPTSLFYLDPAMLKTTGGGTKPVHVVGAPEAEPPSMEPVRSVGEPGIYYARHADTEWDNLPAEGAAGAGTAAPKPNVHAEVSRRGSVQDIVYTDDAGQRIGTAALNGDLLLAVQVHPQFQRKGYGRAILQDAVQRGARHATAGTGQGESLLRAAGWSDDGRGEFSAPEALVGQSPAPTGGYVELSGEGAPTQRVPVKSADQASAVVRRYIDTHGLGSSGWTGGNLVDASGKVIGRVSYNGRVWDNEGKLLQNAFDMETGYRAPGEAATVPSKEGPKQEVATAPLEAPATAKDGATARAKAEQAISDAKKDLAETQTAVNARASERGAVPAELLTAPAEAIARRLGVDKFIEQDLIPKLQGSISGAQQIIRGLTEVIAPRVGVRTDILDSAYKLKGDREKAQFLLEAAVDHMQSALGEKADPAVVAQANAERHLPGLTPLQVFQVDFMDRIKTGQPQRTPELQNIADFLRKADDDLYHEIIKYKDLNFLKDHQRVLWKVIPKPIEEYTGEVTPEQPQKTRSFFARSRRPLQGSRGYMKQHSLDDMSEGIQRGGVPVTYNPVEMFTLHYADVQKFLTAQRWWDDAKRLGARVFVKNGQRVPDGFDPLDDNIANAYFRTREGILASNGKWYVEHGLARIMNNYLSRDLLRAPSGAVGNIGRFLMGVKNLYTSVELTLSAFHLTFIGAEAGASSAGLGLVKFINRGLLQGDAAGARDGLKDIAKGLTIVPAAKEAFQMGRSAIQLVKNPEEFAQTPEGQALLRAVPNAREIMENDIFQGGAKFDVHHEYIRNAIRNFEESVNSGNYPGALFRALPAAIEGMQKPLFEWFIPRVKVGVFLKEFSEQLRQRDDDLRAGVITRAQLARQVWDFVEDRFGEMNFDNAWWNRTFKTALQILFRSPTWRLGTVRAGGKAVASQLREFRTASDMGRKLRLAPETGWLLGMALLTATFSAIVMEAFARKHPKTIQDAIFPQYDPNDDRARLSTPTYAKGYYEMLRSPLNYVTSGTSGFIGKTIDVARNLDFYGHPLWSDEDPEYQKLLKAIEHWGPQPISVESFSRMYEEGHPGKAVMSFTGINKAPAYVSMTPLEQKMLQMTNERPFAVQSERSKLRNKIIQAYRNGDMKTARETAEQGVDAGKLTNADVNHALDWAQFSRLEADFKRLSLQQAVDVMKLATPQERATVEPILEDKMDRSFDKLSPEEQDKLIQKLSRLHLFQQQPAAAAGAR